MFSSILVDCIKNGFSNEYDEPFSDDIPLMYTEHVWITKLFLNSSESRSSALFLLNPSVAKGKVKGYLFSNEYQW